VLVDDDDAVRRLVDDIGIEDLQERHPEAGLRILDLPGRRELTVGLRDQTVHRRKEIG
jgi:hypothetical protein